MTAGSVQFRPPSADMDQISSVGFSPCVASDQNDSPGSSMGVRVPYRNRRPPASRLIETNIDQRVCRYGQIGPCSVHVSPPLAERHRTGTKSLTPSAEASMQEQRTSPSGRTTARGASAMAPGPRVTARCVTKPSRRATNRMRELDRGQRDKSQGREQANGHNV